jgi:hypothetical protein
LTVVFCFFAVEVFLVAVFLTRVFAGSGTLVPLLSVPLKGEWEADWFELPVGEGDGSSFAESPAEVLESDVPESATLEESEFAAFEAVGSEFDEFEAVEAPLSPPEVVDDDPF